ncbi:MAG: hypothetical protein Aurels2KO_25340 [Aureliella sp.]
MSTVPAYTPQRLAWLTLRHQRGESVTYTDGDLVIDLVAVATRPDARQVDATEGFIVSSRAMDWLVDPDELIDEQNNRVEPADGAFITRKSGEKYKLMPTDGSEDTWRWSDPLETWRRINTAKA